jgi:hypothetical protein
MPVALFDSVTDALGITAPVWSRTVPLTVPVLAWGQADGVMMTAINRMQNRRLCSLANLYIDTSK